MITRVHFEDAEAADAAADVLFDAGHEVAVVKERNTFEDDDEEVTYVLATPTPEQTVRALLDLDEDDWVEADA